MKNITEFTNRVINGDSQEVMKEMPEDSVNLVITSPPYFGCRVYGNETVGREEDPRDYIDKIVDFTRDIKRVLRPDGSFYLNIGDMYYGNKQGFGGFKGKDSRSTHKHYEGRKIVESDGKYLQNKQLLMMPPRIASKMQDEGWILRNTLIWHKCLGEGTSLFVKRRGKYEVVLIEDLLKDFDETYLPTQDKEGNTVWIEIKNIFDVGVKNGIRVLTKSGNEVITTKEHRFPFKSSQIHSKKTKYRKIKVKPIGEFSRNDKLYCNYDLDIKIDNGDESDYNMGFFVGFFIAEGSYVWRNYKEYKDNYYSRKSIKRWGESKRGKKKVAITLTCGIKDLSRGYIRILESIVKFKRYEDGNKISLRTYDKNVLKFINKYVSGIYCDQKALTNDAFNVSKEFMRGVLDGFLSGDGHYEKDNKRWRVGIKPNHKLKNQLQLLCRIFGYKFRYEGIRDVTIKGLDKIYNAMYFSIRKNERHENNQLGMRIDNVESINDIGNIHFYDIEVKPLYLGGKGNNQFYKVEKETEEARLSKYNNLYFLMNGIWTHNSNAMPVPAPDRFLPTYEYIFLFVKSDSYYFDLDASKKSVFNGKDIFTVNIEPYKKHQATFPEKLVYPMINISSKRDDIVMDPFGGSGTVARLAKRLGRKFISIEINSDFCEIAEKSISETCSLAKINEEVNTEQSLPANNLFEQL